MLRYYQAEGSDPQPMFDFDMAIDELGDFPVRQGRGLHLQRFGIVALVGMDILDGMVAVFNGPAGHFSLAAR